MARATPERIRVLNILTNFHIGGTERQVTNLALKLNSARFELHLACLRNSGELLEELKTLDIPRPEFRIGSLYSFRTFLQAVKLIRYLRRNRIQMVHSYGTYPNIFTVPAAWLAGVPVIIASIRDRGDILSPWQRRLQKAVCRLADCVLVNASTIRDTLIDQGYRGENIRVIPNGVMPSNRVSCRERGELRAELGLPPGAPVVLVFSRLNRMKGVEYFLEAAVSVLKTFPEVKLVIAGDGANRVELEQYAAQLGIAASVVFTGFRTDLPDLLREADVSVLPSLSEGLSNSLLEAMSAGVPVIATNVGGNPEIVEDGTSGLLVPVRDANALAAAMIRMLADPELRRNLGTAGRRRIASEFSMERSLESVEHLYENLTREDAAS
ncbi:MAG: glycosyltransferase [Acidobacteriota bacterium]|nr:glycosyltransferase [Acidobacteriota bacterium]